ncbi:hypothetical protein KC356_g350 [Hortaea werneckii]|nr:hypothetical protein KC356_g350 [Hortaea werneckii]
MECATFTVSDDADSISELLWLPSSSVQLRLMKFLKKRALANRVCSGKLSAALPFLGISLEHARERRVRGWGQKPAYLGGSEWDQVMLVAAPQRSEGLQPSRRFYYEDKGWWWWGIGESKAGNQTRPFVSMCQ